MFGKFADPLRCLSIAERGTLIVTQNGLLGVRKDFGRALLLESILRPPVMSEDDIVHVELPHNEVNFLLLQLDLQSTKYFGFPGNVATGMSPNHGSGPDGLRTRQHADSSHNSSH